MGWSGAGRGAAVIFFAYIGFDAVSTAAQEAKEPKRDMPIGILGSLAICTVLYILVGLVLTGLVNYKFLNVPDSLAVGMEQTGFRWGSLLVKIGALGGLTSTMIVMLLGQSRRVLLHVEGRSVAEDVLGGTSRFRTPWISSLTVGLVVATFASLIPLASLGEMTSIGTLLAFIIVCAGVWVLRKRSPELPRPFRAPMDAAHADPRHRGVAGDDAGATFSHVAAAGNLAACRAGDLLLLQPQAQQGTDRGGAARAGN